MNGLLTIITAIQFQSANIESLISESNILNPGKSTEFVEN